MILKGWPDRKASVAVEITLYFNIREELAVQDGIIFQGPSCIIPKGLRKKVTQKIHRAHTGVQSCLRRAQEVVFWPSMDQEITNCVGWCDVYNTFAN